MSVSEEVRAKIEAILKETLVTIDTSRMTFRIRLPERGIDWALPVAEALAPGVASMMKDDSIKQGVSPPSSWMRENKRTLRQGNIATDSIVPPPGLTVSYGAKAQMLCPVFKNDELIGWVSAHYQPSPRVWSDEDAAAIERARDAIVELIKP